MRTNGSGAYSRAAPVPRMPAGLPQLMEDLTKNLLRHNPEDIFQFCADHMAKLIEIRDGRPPRKPLTLEQKIKRAQNLVKKRVDERRKKYEEEMMKFLQEQELHNVEEKSQQTIKVPLHQEIEIFHNVDKDKNNEANSINTSFMNASQDRASVNDVEDVTELDIYEDVNKNQQSQQDIQEDTANPPTANLKETFHTPNIQCTNDATLQKSYSAKENNNEFIPEMVVTDVITKSELAVQAASHHDSVKLIEETCDGNINTGKLVEKKFNGNRDKDKEIENVANNVHKHDFFNEEVNLNEITKTEMLNLGDNNNEKSNNIGDVNENGHIQKNENNDIKMSSELVAFHDANNSDEFKNSIQSHEFNEDKQNVLNTQSVTESDNKFVERQVLEINEDNFENQKSNHFSEDEADSKKQQFDNNLEKNASERKDTDDTYEKTHRFKNDNKDENNSFENSLDPDLQLTKDQIDSSSTKDVKKIVEDNSNELKVNVSSVELSTASEFLSAESGTESIIKLTVAESPIQVNDTPNDLNNIKHCDSESDHNTTSSSNDKKNYLHIPDVEKNKHFDDTSDTLDNVSNISEVISLEVDATVIENIGDTDNSNVASVDTNVDEDVNPNKHSMDLETAAVTIQKVFRLFMFKSRCSTFDESVNEETNIDEDSDDAEKDNGFSTTFNKDRRPLGISRMDTVLQTVNEEKSLSLSTDDSSTLSSAATTIQAHVRGFLVRNKLNSNKSSIVDTLGMSTPSLESETDPQKNKTVLNIHIVPEGGHFLSRDESLLTSVELSLESSPPSSVNLHPLGYDKNEPRKQLKREDAIQSISPPSYNSGKMSEDVDSFKDVLADDATELSKDEQSYCQIVDDTSESQKSDDTSEKISTETTKSANTLEQIQEMKQSQVEDITKVSNNNRDDLRKDNEETEILDDDKSLIPTMNMNDITKQVSLLNNVNGKFGETMDAIVKDTEDLSNKSQVYKTSTSASVIKEKVDSNVENMDSLTKVDNTTQVLVIDSSNDTFQPDTQKHIQRKMSSDETDVIIAPVKCATGESNISSKLMHSGEFHDVVLPTKVSRTDTSVVRGE